jgi:AcrR family transcriptional regulator
VEEGGIADIRDRQPPRAAGGNGLRQPRLTAEQRQIGIVEAATEVFARRGYEGARIDEIAATAGVSKALIYDHFAGKRQLYGHIMRQGTEEHLRCVLEAAARGDGSVLRMERGLRAFLDFVAEHTTLWRVIEQQVSDPEIIAIDQSQQHRSELAIAQLLAADEEMAKQDMSAEQLELLAVMINGASVRAANWWIENPSTPRDEVLLLLMRFMWLGLERIRRANHDGKVALTDR